MRDTRLALAALAALVALAGCAGTPKPVEKDPWYDAPARTAGATDDPAAGAREGLTPTPADTSLPPESLSPAAYAARYPKADACEAEARRIHKAAPDRSWALLSACVARGKFTLLARLLEAPWVHELQERNEAAILLGRVVAARGGDILGDLASLRSARVPIFGLETAMRNPALYKGRVLIFRARVDEMKPLANKKATLRLAQVDLTTQDKYVVLGGFQTRTSGSSSISEKGSGSYREKDNGRKYSGSAEGSDSYSNARSSERTYEFSWRRPDNGLMETGRVVLARLDAPDPFLEPGMNVVVVGRFDGVREVPGQEEDQEAQTFAVITLFGYFEPAAILAQ